MKHHFVITAMAVSTALCTFGAEKSLKISQLPVPVQKRVQDETKYATLGNISKEMKGGKTFYEVETTHNGKSRDLVVDTEGVVVELEEETPLESLPAAAQAAISKKAAGGTVTKVEAITKGGKTLYEATIDKNGKASEFTVTAAGASAK